MRDDAVETSCDQLVSSLNGMEQGVRKLWWKDDGNGNMKIVASSFQPRDVGLRAHFLETISGDISAMLEEWRKARQAGKVDDYISHYTSGCRAAGQAGRAKYQAPERRALESRQARDRGAFGECA